MKRIMNEMNEKFGPPPESWTYGDGIDWSSPLLETIMDVELPFWLMMPEGEVTVNWSGIEFDITVNQLRMECFLDFFTDSRQTMIFQGPLNPNLIMHPDRLAKNSAEQGHPVVVRPCKTVLGLKAFAHTDAFRELTDTDRPGVAREHGTYWASLCEAHIPIVNELIQRYRFRTYDHFPYEVSAWDVPVWYLKQSERQERALLITYKGWDMRPVIVEDGDSPGGDPKLTQFEWTSPSEIESVSSEDASPGEFDLLDARSLMERGDYTGAVRRTVTAIEALVAGRLLAELQETNSLEDAEQKLKKTANNFPRRLSQWQSLSNTKLPEPLKASFFETRRMRHEIVHRGRRLTIAERGRAQRAVDTGRWLYNRVEARPDRVDVREKGTLKSAGRVTIDVRFPATIGPQGITLGPLGS